MSEVDELLRQLLPDKAGAVTRYCTYERVFMDILVATR